MSRRDYVDIGPAPFEIMPAQVGSPDYSRRAVRECRVFIRQLVRMFGDPPVGAELKIMACPHEFGTYREVVCWFSDRAGLDYALLLEREGPGKWDQEALEELALAEEKD